MNPANKQKEGTTLSSVQITSERISELDSGQIVKTIERAKIISISLKYGISSERTILQVAFSIILIGAGLFFGLIPVGEMLLDAYYHQEVKIGRAGGRGLIFLIFSIFFIPFGVSTLLSAIRKRFYLAVKTTNDQRKIIFDDDISFIDIKIFIESVKLNYGYDIRLDNNELLNFESKVGR